MSDEQILEQARALAADHPVLLEALDRLEALPELPLEEHVAQFDAVHKALREVLSGQS